MTEASWREFRLHLGMPHLSPGRLAEEPILKQLGAFQWQAAAELAGQPENAVVTQDGERLHISMVSLELGLPAGRNWDEFDEGCELVFRQRTGVFGHKLVEGLYSFDKAPIPEDELEAVQSRDDLARGRRPWAYLTHGFITSAGGTWAKLEMPHAYLQLPVPELLAMPVGIAEHVAVERSGLIEGFPEWAQAVELPRDSHPATPATFEYEVQPETDFNAVGVVYCARLPAIMASGERRFLRERLSAPLSQPLVASLSPQHRRIYYFANASREARLCIRVQARFRPPAAAAPSRMRTLGYVMFRTDVHRASDGVLMSSSLVEKALRVPGMSKPLQTEVERLLGRLQARG